MDTLYETVRKYVVEFGNNVIQNGKPYAHFLKIFYGTHDTVENSQSVPDIGGYVLAYIKPPVLSGLKNKFSSRTEIIEKAKNTVFFIQDITPPETTLNTSQMSGSTITIPFATGKTSGGQMSVSFLENENVDMYSFHHTWFHYIEQVLYGEEEYKPDDKYIESGELDYATCAYIIKYKPNMQDVVYIGKMIGIFPINLPNKEIIGSRNQNQITIYNVNYICTDYREVVFSDTDKIDSNWVLEDFQADVLSMFH